MLQHLPRKKRCVACPWEGTKVDRYETDSMKHNLAADAATL